MTIIPTRYAGTQEIDGYLWTVFELAHPIETWEGVTLLASDLLVASDLVNSNGMVNISIARNVPTPNAPDAIYLTGRTDRVLVRGPRAYVATENWRCPILVVIA